MSRKKISYFQNKKIITSIMTPQHILLVISATIMAPFMKNGKCELKSLKEENQYKHSLTNFIINAVSNKS